MKIILVRHGKTQSNQEHRYLGWTDELLCREGIALLLKKAEGTVSSISRPGGVQPHAALHPDGGMDLPKGLSL